MPTFASTLAHARAPFLLAPLLVLSAAAAQAQSFTVTDTSNAARTLANKGDVGAITATGRLDVHDGNVAITVGANGQTIDNQGMLLQSGTGANAGRAIRDNTGVTGLVINNGSKTNTGALMQTADGDVIQLNKAKSAATLNNWGSLVSMNASAGGSQAVDFSAAAGANVVNNYASGLLKALEADAVRPGAGGTVNNWGRIVSSTTTGSSSDGVDGQSNSGITVANNAGSIEGGRHGITGGAADASVAFSMMVTNLMGATIQGDNGSGINIDGFNGKEVVTVNNAGLIVGHGVTGDGDGVDVDGLVRLVNTGVIRSLNAVDPAGAFSEGLSVGGGTITNSGTIEGLVAAGNANAKGIGITLTGNDITDPVTKKDTGQRDGLYGDASVTNQAGGLIRGQNSSAIVLKGNASAFTASIDNQAGATLRGGGTTDAAIQGGADAVTIRNAGTIDGSSSGRAFAGGGGRVTFTITGGSAVVLGNIDGGSAAGNRLTIAPGAGNSFAYASGISNFDTVEIASGSVRLSGVNTYTGTTAVDAGATLVLDGAGRLAAASHLDLEGGTLRLANAGGADGQQFAPLAVGHDSAIDLGGSSITFGALDGHVGGGLDIDGWLASTSPTYAIRFLGDLTGDAAFRALMSGTSVDNLAAAWHFDGVYTDVTAVPEPASLALLLAGGGLLGVAARRRRSIAD